MFVDESSRTCHSVHPDSGEIAAFPPGQPAKQPSQPSVVHYAVGQSSLTGYACDGRRVWHRRFSADDQSGSAETVVATQGYQATAPSSPLKFFGNGSIGTRYVNPNKLLVATQWRSAEKREATLGVYLFDTVTGQELLHLTHRHGEQPVRLFQYENWVGYQYWHAHAHRFEFVSVELFAPSSSSSSSSSTQKPVAFPFFQQAAEGEKKNPQLDYAVPFSSYDRLVPSSYSAAFIAPFPVDAIAVTDSLRGLTPRHLLFATAGGRVVSVDARVFDPRRPLSAALSEEQRAEELMAYHPEIAFPSRSLLSYNLSLTGLAQLVTSPTLVESTSLIFAYGLDLFSTRFAPAQQFDLLQSEFNKPLLILTVVILLSLTLCTWLYLQWRNLKYLWN